MSYQINTSDNSDNRSIRFNLANPKPIKSARNKNKLNFAFVDTMAQQRPSLFSSRLEYTEVGRSTTWKRPEGFSIRERYDFEPMNASVTSGSPKTYYIDTKNSAEQDIVNMLHTGKRAVVRYDDDFNYTSSMYNELNMSMQSAGSNQHGGLFDITSRVKIQKRDPMIDFDANVIIKFVQQIKWKIRQEWFKRNDNARIIQNWVHLLFLKIKKRKQEKKDRDNNAAVIQKFVRRIYKIRFAARIIQAFLANHKTQPPVERFVSAKGCYCSKKVLNRKSAHWAATIIQTKFRNIRRKLVEPRIKKIITCPGLLTKKIFNMKKFVQKVIALQAFYRKLKARQLVSAKIIQDFVENDIKKKCKVKKVVIVKEEPVAVQFKTKQFCLFTKAIKKTAKTPITRVIANNKFSYFTKTHRREEIIPKQKVTAKKCVLMIKKTKSLRVLKIVIFLQRVIKRFLAMRKQTQIIPKLHKFSYFTKSIRAQQAKAISKPILADRKSMAKKCMSKKMLTVVMLLQRAIKRFLYSRLPEAITLPVICQQHQLASKKIKSRLVDDYAKRIQEMWKMHRTRPVKVFVREEPRPIFKKRIVNPIRISKKTTSMKVLNYVIYIQRFYRSLCKTIETTSYPQVSKFTYFTKEVKVKPPVPKKRVILQKLERKTKSTLNLYFILRLQHYVRRFLKNSTKPKQKPRVDSFCYYSKKIKHQPDPKAIKVQSLLRSFVIIQRTKKAIAMNHIRRMANLNWVYQLKKYAKYSRRRLYAIDFVLTLERQAVKVAQELLFIKLADVTGLNKGLLNEIDDRENYYYRTIKSLKNLAQKTNTSRLNKEVVKSITPTFKMVLSKFPLEVRNIYSYKWFTAERLADDKELWNTNVYKTKLDPNFVNMIKYLLKDHELAKGYVEKRIQNTHVENLTIFALFQMSEMFLYDYYNDLTCKFCFCKKGEDYDNCENRFHEKLKLTVQILKKPVVEADKDQDPLNKISLKPNPKYDVAYDSLTQNTEEDEKTSKNKKSRLIAKEKVEPVKVPEETNTPEPSKEPEVEPIKTQENEPLKTPDEEPSKPPQQFVNGKDSSTNTRDFKKIADDDNEVDIGKFGYILN
jgi:hypothetical protein